jgi:hypothetical protein
MLDTTDAISARRVFWLSWRFSELNRILCADDCAKRFQEQDFFRVESLCLPTDDQRASTALVRAAVRPAKRPVLRLLLLEALARSFHPQVKLEREQKVLEGIPGRALHREMKAGLRT